MSLILLKLTGILKKKLTATAKSDRRSAAQKEGKKYHFMYPCSPCSPSRLKILQFLKKRLTATAKKAQKEGRKEVPLHVSLFALFAFAVSSSYLYF
jgi:hypothetical protein